MPRPPRRALMVDRLLKLMDHMVKSLENDLKKRLSPIGEAEVMVLVRLAHGMGKLIDLEARAGNLSAEAETREMQDIRDKLVQRIDELKRN